MAAILAGKVAIVTGAGRGIGRAIAITLAEQGASVVVNDLGGALDGSGKASGPADEVVEEIRRAGGTAVASYGSVADFAAAGQMVTAALDSFGKLDILVNVAGIERAKMVFNMAEEDWSKVVAVHLTGTFNCTRHASIVMRQQRSGRIVNVTSDAWRGTVGHCNYGAAKGGIVSLTLAVARELGRYGATANAIAPMAGTRMILTDDVRQGMQKRLKAGLITREQMEIALNPPGPEHVGPFVAYLASDLATNINGQVFHVEAGRIGIYSQPVEVKSVYRDYEKYGRWTVEEIAAMVPKSLLTEYVNPAPAQGDAGRRP